MKKVLIVATLIAAFATPALAADFYIAPFGSFIQQHFGYAPYRGQFIGGVLGGGSINRPRAVVLGLALRRSVRG
jgi:opacity protein-like surface antigen